MEIFSKWLIEFDKRFNRKLFLVDNAAGHSITQDTFSKLNNVTLHFLPPNTTSVLQPCDAGIIEFLKTEYKKLVVQYYLNCIETRKEIIPADIKQAMIMVNKAWNCVSKETIANCWRHYDILGNSPEPRKPIKPHIEEMLKNFDNLFDRLSFFCHPDDKSFSPAQLKEPFSNL